MVCLGSFLGGVKGRLNSINSSNSCGDCYVELGKSHTPLRKDHRSSQIILYKDTRYSVAGLDVIQKTEMRTKLPQCRIMSPFFFSFFSISCW